MHRYALAALCFAWLLPAPSLAQAPEQMPCPLNYEIFKYAIPHIGMDQCPKDLAGDKVFCRATAGNDAVHVFAFAEGTQCLQAVQSYDAFELRIE
jgi:hypothetical protein